MGTRLGEGGRRRQTAFLPSRRRPPLLALALLHEEDERIVPMSEAEGASEIMGFLADLGREAQASVPGPRARDYGG
jgi:hypothetical protein